jgi:hypothetical protein
MGDYVSVRFLRPASGYNEGEIAGFPTKRADELIRQKYAEPFAARAAVTKSQDLPKGSVAPTVLPPESPTQPKPSKPSIFKKRGK